MSLNIKNERTHRLVQELASLRGVTLVAAVTDAVEEMLERQRNEEKKKDRLEWLIKLSERTAPLLRDLPSSDKIGYLLFDKETGLPL